MVVRRAAAVVILSAVVVGLAGCGDDVTVVDADEASCDAATPVRVAELAAGVSGEIHLGDVAGRLYINVYDLFDPENPHNNVRPGIAAVVDAQTWVTGPCGEDAVLVGEGLAFASEGESLGTLGPVFYGRDTADADPTLACEVGGSGRDRIYRVDLTGASRPELLLENWGCVIDVDRMVTTHRNGELEELWRVPNFPDLDGAVRLAADIHEKVGQDATHEYYLDGAQALRSLDIVTGVDEVLATGVAEATGGATGSFFPWERTGPTRLLVLAKVADDAAEAYLYRGESGEMVRLADVLPADLPEPPQNGWVWRFDDAYGYLYYLPSGGGEPYARVFDLDLAPLVFPAGVRASRLLSSGLLGSVEGPQGSSWVFARPGGAEATVLDLAWGPELTISTATAEDLYRFQDGRLYRTPLDGGPTIEVLDYGHHYTRDDALMKHDDDLLHVDWNTNAVTVLVEDVGAYALVGDVGDDAFTARGVFYTDISSPEEPSLWFMPAALLPGAR